MLESVQAIVDEGIILENTKLLRKTLNQETKIIAVIKANGYGLGITEVAHTCEKLGIDILAVLDVYQAKQLRDAGITSPILLLGATIESDFNYLHELDLIQVIFDLDFAKRLNSYALSKNLRIKGHVKVDTGLNRLGMRSVDDIEACYHLDGLDIQGIYSHFVEAQNGEGDALEFSKLQIERFDSVLEELRSKNIEVGMTHMQNSPSILQFGDLGYDAVRCGMILFGLFHPSQLESAYSLGYRCCLRLETRIAMIHTVYPGDFIGYSRSYAVTKEMKIATISSGYCDGVMKALSLNGGSVIVNGKACKILGDIAMSQFMIDVSDVECQAEDVVVIFGDENQSIYDYIRITGQSINELISHLRYTIPRRYINTI